MNITRAARDLTRLLLSCFLIGGLPVSMASAWQVHTQPVVQPASSGAAFQQSMQQQQARDQLQKSQLQQQLQQGVADTAKRPLGDHPRTVEQLDQAQQAQRDRDRANLQDLANRKRDASLPRVVPQNLPVPAKSGKD